jgi:hypothetical protein
MAKEGLDLAGHYRCCSLCGVVIMIFWTLVGFVAGLVVVTIAIRVTNSGMCGVGW